MNSQAIYQRLLDNPGDVVIMQVLADALEDEWNTSLSNAYRWAAKHEKWPTVFRKVTDRTIELWMWGRPYNRRVTQSSLPHSIHQALIKLCNDSRITAETVEGAFVLLARTLESVHAAK